MDELERTKDIIFDYYYFEAKSLGLEEVQLGCRTPVVINIVEGRVEEATQEISRFGIYEWELRGGGGGGRFKYIDRQHPTTSEYNSSELAAKQSDVKSQNLAIIQLKGYLRLIHPRWCCRTPLF